VARTGRNLISQEQSEKTHKMSAQVTIKEMSSDGTVVHSLQIMQIDKESLLNECGVYRAFQEEFGDDHEFSFVMPCGVDWRVAKIFAKCLQRICGPHDETVYTKKCRGEADITITANRRVNAILDALAAENDAEALLGILCVADKDDIPALGRALHIVVMTVLTNADGTWLAECVLKDAAWDVECMGDLHRSVGISAISCIMDLDRLMDDMKEALDQKQQQKPEAQSMIQMSFAMGKQSAGWQVLDKLRRSEWLSVKHLNLNKGMLQEAWACRAMSAMIVDMYARVTEAFKTM